MLERTDDNGEVVSFELSFDVPDVDPHVLEEKVWDELHGELANLEKKYAAKLATLAQKNS